jgi:hypothetical protein
MGPFIQYVGRWQRVQGNLSGLKPWARYVVVIFALPGIALTVLSIAALGVSILALLLLTLPVYRIMLAVAGQKTGSAGTTASARQQIEMVEGTLMPDNDASETVNDE